jgi:hypothetical protein
MATTSVILAGIDTAFLALTPIERWNAARRIDSVSADQRWFIILSVIAVILLTAMFIASSYNQRNKERKISNTGFSNYARRIGLNRRERKILRDIANRANLKRIDSIFTMDRAFDRGSAELIKEILANRRAGISQNLSAQLSVLREKLGFENRRSPMPAGSAVNSDKASTRQIPTGKQLHMTRRKSFEQTDIESTVIENNEVELTVKLEASLESKPGELWSVRYYFGASVWEFETSSVSCYGNILVLNHSDNIRFVNRRRFLRVPVNKPTFIARFPFTRMLLPKSYSGNGAEHDSADTSENNWGPPEFVPASVTELAGPGLRIEAPLEVKVGDRVLVILKLGEEDQKPASQRTGRVEPEKVVEDIGQVRHTKSIKNGFSIAVELTGLSEPNIGELIRATNAASLKARAKNKAAQTFNGSNDKQPKEQEPAAAQGV